MSIRGLASRYSKVLFKIDQKNGKLDLRLKDFKVLDGVLKANSDLVHFLKSPQILLEEKKTLLYDIFENKIDYVFLNFICFLTERKRVDILPLIAEEYENRVNRDLGIWKAEIITASPIDEEVSNRFKSKAEEHFNKKIHLKEKIDPSIIGGAILFIGNRMVDWSLKGRLRKLKEKLINEF